MHRSFALYGCLLLGMLLAAILAPHVSYAVDFDVMIVPSLMDSDMDGWYRVPMNSGPVIQRTTQVTQGQSFNLLIFFKGYTPDKSNKIHIRYDVQVYDPAGRPTEDREKDLLAYQGEIGKNRDMLLLNQQFLKVLFTEKYRPGTYKIKVTAYDKIAHKKFTKETPIELIGFTKGDRFSSEKEFGEWMAGYYRNPAPTKAIYGVLQFIQLDPEWMNKKAGVLAFFRRVFSDNPFLLKNISKDVNVYTGSEKKKLILIAALSNDTMHARRIAGEDKDLLGFLDLAEKLKLPDTDGEITTADQLDVLWGEFMAAGRYQPVKKLVSALALYRYRGTIDRITSGEIREKTSEIEREAQFDATYQAAVWSLINNCKHMPLVFKYCVFIYENETLPEDLKGQLGAVLSVAQKEIEKEEKKK